MFQKFLLLPHASPQRERQPADASSGFPPCLLARSQAAQQCFLLFGQLHGKANAFNRLDIRNKVRFGAELREVVLAHADLGERDTALRDLPVVEPKKNVLKVRFSMCIPRLSIIQQFQPDAK